MQRLLVQISLLLLLPAVAMAGKYAGTYVLQEATNENNEPVHVPGHFDLVLRSEGKDGDEDGSYGMSLRIGNALRARVRISESSAGGPEAIDIGPIMSTMMMPPENLFKLEQFMSHALPEMTTIELGQDGKLTLTSEGSEKVVFEQKEE